jgi:hypothetical protein
MQSLDRNVSRCQSTRDELQAHISLYPIDNSVSTTLQYGLYHRIPRRVKAVCICRTFGPVRRGLRSEGVLASSGGARPREEAAPAP